MKLNSAWNETNHYLENTMMTKDHTILCMELNQLLFGTCDYN